MYEFGQIGVIHSCYTDKFGVPRQPGLVMSAEATLEMLPPYNAVEAVRGLDQFSHVWILFVFDRISRGEWKATVRPPRLGGNERIGVFASRSNFRPNPIGLSVVELVSINLEKGKVLIKLRGGDFLDGTPVLDIKPYVPYVDGCPEAKDGFAIGAPVAGNRVSLTEEAEASCRQLENDSRPNLLQLIHDMLRFDPRPAYRCEHTDEQTYGTSLYDLNIKWRQRENLITVFEVKKTISG